MFLIGCLTQGIIASFHSNESLVTPNAESGIARSLARTGTYAGGEWSRLREVFGEQNAGAPQMFALPGEPLYLAFGFRFLPQSWWRYLHVPVTASLVAAGAWFGFQVGGPKVGWLAATIALLNPFTLLHGCIWDDTFLGAFLDWMAILIVWKMLEQPGSNGHLFLLAIVSAAAAATRSTSQVFLGVMVLAILIVPVLRQARWGAVAIMVGMSISLVAWGVRNHQVSGRFFVGSTHDGITLWESVYPHAAEALLTHGQTERMNDQYMLDDFAKTRAMSEIEANSYFTHRAEAFILQYPWAVTKTAIIKIGVDLIGTDPSLPWRLPRNLVAITSNVLLIGLAIPAFVERKLWKTLPPPLKVYVRWVTIALLGTILAVMFVGPVGLRYRTSAEPLLWTAASMTICSVLRRTKPRVDAFSTD